MEGSKEIMSRRIALENIVSGGVEGSFLLFVFGREAQKFIVQAGMGYIGIRLIDRHNRTLTSF
jgi:hypothetical protein